MAATNAQPKADLLNLIFFGETGVGKSSLINSKHPIGNTMINPLDDFIKSFLHSSSQFLSLRDFWTSPRLRSEVHYSLHIYNHR